MEETISETIGGRQFWAAFTITHKLSLVTLLTGGSVALVGGGCLGCDRS